MSIGTEAVHVDQPTATARRRRRIQYTVSAPLMLWIIVALVVPFGLMALYSFWQVNESKVVHQWTWDNYRTFLADPLYRSLLIKTIWSSAVIGVVAALLGLVLALFVRQCPPRSQSFLFMVVLTPLWVDYLTRIFAWQTLLGENGLLNTALTNLGLIDQPITLLSYNVSAVMVVLISVTTPFAFIPTYVAIENIPESLVSAARDLGAPERKVFQSVVLPLALPGLITGFTLSFIYAIGDYLTPSLVGGTTGQMLGNSIESQFFVYNWPLGAAMTAVLFCMVIALLAIVARPATKEAVLTG